jgi:hypothetical protein
VAWTEITRPRYQREGLRYASDTTDEEWVIIAPHLPAPASCGRRRKHDLARSFPVSRVPDHARAKLVSKSSQISESTTRAS